MSLWSCVSLPSLPILLPHTPSPPHPNADRSYRNLNPRTRLIFGAALMSWAAIGIYASDHLERAFGLVPTEEEKERVNVRVVRVDREDVGKS